MPEFRPVGSGVTDNKSGDADGGDGGKERVDKRCPDSVCGGHR